MITQHPCAAAAGLIASTLNRHPNPQSPFAPENKVAPEFEPLLGAARQAAADAGVPLHAPAAVDDSLRPSHPQKKTTEANGSEKGKGEEEEQQQQQQQGQGQGQEEEAGGAERRAHAALLAHPIARQLRTVPRAGPGQAGVQGGEGRVLIGVRFPSVWDQDLRRLGVGGGRAFAPAAAAAADWARPLAALATAGGAAAGCAPRAHAEGERSLTVSVCAHELGAAVAWLAAQPQVHWLEPRRRMQLHNRMAGAIVEGAISGAATDDAAALSMHPFWPLGLRGEGQVVGVGDSGLDVDSCYFFDPAVPFAANSQSVPTGRAFASDAHRKVAYYLGRLDKEMLDTVGHGTHVCGTIAGAPLGAANDASDPGVGMAPGARIGFIDLSVSGSNEVGVPDDLERDYFPLAFERGVRIHSGGWGAGRGGVHTHVA